MNHHKFLLAKSDDESFYKALPYQQGSHYPFYCYAHTITMPPIPEYRSDAMAKSTQATPIPEKCNIYIEKLTASFA